jgi:hypothetical protein
MDTAGYVAAGVTAVIGEYARQALFASAARARARRSQGTTTYDVTRASRAVFVLAAIIFGGLIVAILVNGDDWRLTLLLAPFLLLCVLAPPGPIRVDAAGISTRRWYTRETRILWRELIEVRGPDRLGQVFVRGGNGQEITHTGLHAGAVEFHRHVMRYARVPNQIPGPFVYSGHIQYGHVHADRHHTPAHPSRPQ